MINNVSALIANTSVSSFSKCTNSKVNLIPNEAIGVISNNSKRVYAAFINNGQTDITLVLDDKSKAVIDKGIVIKGYGGSYERGFTLKILEPHQTLPWLQQVAHEALREAKHERRRREFRETLERIRRLRR